MGISYFEFYLFLTLFVDSFSNGWFICGVACMIVYLRRATKYFSQTPSRISNPASRIRRRIFFPTNNDVDYGYYYVSFMPTFLAYVTK